MQSTFLMQQCNCLEKELTYLIDIFVIEETFCPLNYKMLFTRPLKKKTFEIYPTNFVILDPFIYRSFLGGKGGMGV